MKLHNFEMPLFRHRKMDRRDARAFPPASSNVSKLMIYMVNLYLADVVNISGKLCA